MDKKKIIYIGILLIVTVLISITYFSYAFFTSRIEQHGKLNIVAGTLDYQIESNDLENNAITLESNTTKVIEIKITSLNTINSKYELYYNSDNNIEIGYKNTNDTPTGVINKNETKIVVVTIKNKSTEENTITFGVIGGFIDNQLVLETGNSITDIINGICDYESGYTWDFPFDPDGDGKGQEQTFTVPCNGDYQLEVWGAKGANLSSSTKGGYGGYAVVQINLLTTPTLYINVGGIGSCKNGPTGSGNCASTGPGGYNGGGSIRPCDYTNACSGGGATHIALSSGLLQELEENKSSILIVAGGGGGSGYNTYYKKGSSGGSGGGGFGTSSSTLSSTFGKGADSGAYNSAGGGGYYGGKVSVNYHSGSSPGAGGGSGYIGSSLLYQNTESNIVNKMYCYNCTESSEFTTYTVSTYGTTTHENERDTTNCPNGYSSNPVSKCAMANNGYARITYLGN